MQQSLTISPFVIDGNTNSKKTSTTKTTLHQEALKQLSPYLETSYILGFFLSLDFTLFLSLPLLFKLLLPFTLCFSDITLSLFDINGKGKHLHISPANYFLSHLLSLHFSFSTSLPPLGAQYMLPLTTSTKEHHYLLPLRSNLHQSRILNNP